MYYNLNYNLNYFKYMATEKQKETAKKNLKKAQDAKSSKGSGGSSKSGK